MTFAEMLAQVVEVLRRERRVSYRALRRRFGLDEEYLEDLKIEIIQAKQLATDEDNTILVWTGDTTPSISTPERPPLAYTPAHLSEKILTIRVRHRHGMEMQLRVGLNSGAVVVRAIGDDLHMDYAAVGQATRLAARMEQLAPPGSIRLTAETLRLAEGFVQVTALGLIPVKGLTEPVAVWELVGGTTLRRRLQAAVTRGLSPFVGRQPEVAALRQALARAWAGQGQVVALIGEPGVGKSRLVYEFLHSHHIQDWLRLESSLVSYGKATAYLPVCDRFKPYCHIEDRDDLRTVRAKVTGQALLAARIDRLPLEDKRLLQTAAVIGTEVPWPLLQTIADTSDEVLYRSLAQLQAAEFLYETSLFPERAYTFKHALTHEVAYGRQAGDKALTRSAYREAVVCAAINLYRDMAMTFWLPQAEAALAQAVG